MKLFCAAYFIIFLQVVSSKEQTAKVSESVTLEGPSELDAILLECPKFNQPRPCESQLLVNIRVSPSANVEAVDKFFVLDEVYDPLKRVKAKILSPYLIAVSRGEPVIMYPLQFTKTISVSKNNTPTEKKKNVTKTTERSIRRFYDEKKIFSNCEDNDNDKRPTYPKENHDNSGEVNAEHFRKLTSRNVRSNHDDINNQQIYDQRKSFNRHHNNINNGIYGKIYEARNRASDSYKKLAHLGFVQYVAPPNIRPSKDFDYLYNGTNLDFNTHSLTDKSLPTVDVLDTDFTVDVSGTETSAMENKSMPYKPNVKLMGFRKGSASLPTLKDMLKNKNLTKLALNASDDIFSDLNREMERLRRKYPSRNNEQYDLDELNLNTKEPKAENYLEKLGQPDLNSKLPSYELDGSVPSENKPLRKDFGQLDDTEFKVLSKSWSKSHGPESHDEKNFDENQYNSISEEYYKKLEDTVNNYTPGDFVTRGSRPHDREMRLENPAVDTYGAQDRYYSPKMYESEYENPFKLKYEKDNSSTTLNAPLKSLTLTKHSIKKRNIASYSPLDSLKSQSKRHGQRSKQKRSYYMYDDLDFQDSRKESDVDSNNLAMNILADNSDISKADDLESCNSCGGKNKNPTPGKPDCFNSKCSSSMPAEKIRDETEDAACDSCGGKNKKPPPPTEKPGCFNQKCSSSGSECVRDETENASCDSCGGKNKKPPPPPDKPGCLFQPGANVLLNIPDGAEDASCDSCGGKNKKPPPPPDKSGCFMQNCDNNNNNALPESIREEAYDVSCDSCGGKNKTPPPKKTGCLFQNAPDETEDVPCDSCGGKNKKPPPDKPGCSLENYGSIPEINIKGFEEPLSSAYENKEKTAQTEKVDFLANANEILNGPNEVPCDSCGGKNKKPAPKESGSFDQNTAYSNVKPIKENKQDEYNDVPCTSCRRNRKFGGGKPVRDSLGNICNCLNDPASCRCESLKNPRSVNDTYSVFNMSVPVPFLTTKIRVFRKRYKSWWRIIPEITLNSLSGIFANGNLSVLFSSHVDILQLEKSLCFQKQNLLVPSKGGTATTSIDTNSQTPVPLTTDPKRIFAVNSYAGNVGDIDSSIFHEQAFHDSMEFWDDNQNQFKGAKKNNLPTAGITPLSDLGYFPTSMNLLDQCPNDKNRLCLNMLDDQVPAFSIKMKMPFRENMVIKPNVLKVKISRIVTDATTKDAVQVSIDVINKGFETHEFYISLSECPFSCGTASKTTVRKVLMPYIGETVTFLLPLITKPKERHKKIKCDVVVKALPIIIEPKEPVKTNSCPSSIEKRSDESKMIIVAKREMEVEVQGRCFCIWKCKCHCMQKLETHVNFDVCQKMSYNSERDAGLLLNCPAAPQSEDVCLMDSYNMEDAMNPEDFSDIMANLLLLLIILLILGLLKALLGLCNERINQLWYDWVQPGGSYDCASKIRRFLVNFAFFLLLPFMLCCKCFKPTEEDLMVANANWECKGPDCNKDKNQKKKDYTDDEEEIILKKTDETKKKKKTKKKTKTKKERKSDNRLPAGIESSITQSQSSSSSDEVVHKIVESSDSNSEYDVHSTCLIWETLSKSKTTLETMKEKRQSVMSVFEKQKAGAIRIPETEEHSEAMDFVNNLKSAGVVFRTFDRPMESMKGIPPNFKYCVQGYFISVHGIYQYINAMPLIQFICVGEDGQTTQYLRPAVFLIAEQFSRTYKNPEEVYQANDLTIVQPYNVPCINIMNVNTVTEALIKLDKYPYRIRDPENKFKASSQPFEESSKASECSSLEITFPGETNENIGPVNVIYEHMGSITESSDLNEILIDQNDKTRVKESRVEESRGQVMENVDLSEESDGPIEEILKLTFKK